MPIPETCYDVGLAGPLCPWVVVDSAMALTRTCDVRPVFLLQKLSILLDSMFNNTSPKSV